MSPTDGADRTATPTPIRLSASPSAPSTPRRRVTTGPREGRDDAEGEQRQRRQQAERSVRQPGRETDVGHQRPDAGEGRAEVERHEHDACDEEPSSAADDRAREAGGLRRCGERCVERSHRALVAAVGAVPVRTDDDRHVRVHGRILDAEDDDDLGEEGLCRAGVVATRVCPERRPVVAHVEREAVGRRARNAGCGVGGRERLDATVIGRRGLADGRASPRRSGRRA